MLALLCDHMNSLTGLCNPSLSRIAEQANSSHKTIERHITRLRERGLVAVTHHGPKPTDYLFPTYDNLSEVDEATYDNLDPLPTTICPPTYDKNDLVLTGNKQGSNRESKARPKSVVNVLEYFASIDQPASEAERFFDHFESNGWKVGGRGAMKDWQASARNWARRSKEFSNDKRKSASDITRELLGDSWGTPRFDGSPVPVVPNHPGGQLIEHQENVGGAPAGISARGHREGGDSDD